MKSDEKESTVQLCAVRQAINKHLPEIIHKLVESAKAGDIEASRLLLETVLPPTKPVEKAVARLNNIEYLKRRLYLLKLDREILKQDIYIP